MRRIKLLCLFLSATPRPQEKAGHAYVSAICLDLPVLVVLYASQWQDIYFAGIIEKGR